MRAARIAGWEAQRTFILAGRATLTLRSPKPPQRRYTYRVQAGDDEKRPPIWFVHVLVGPDNLEDYRYLGFIGHDWVWRHGRKSAIRQSAPSAMAWSWCWRRIAGGESLLGVELWHSGHCGRCGRQLTVPESLSTGLGPECRNKVLGDGR